MTGPREPQDPSRNTHGEFDVAVFVERYEEIADTFIDTKGAAASLKKTLPRGSQIFELGMGTGYFGQFLAKDGYRVSGIQPADGMLARLRRDHPELDVVAERYIQDYKFTGQHDAIVSHSSVFLFTRPDALMQEYEKENLIFQSFIQDGVETFQNMDKVMQALTPGGRLFVNIQPNAKPFAEIDPTLSFEMPSYRYNFDRNRVEKTFAITSNGERRVLEPDVSYVLKWEEFDPIMRLRGYQAKVSDDGYWVMISSAQPPGIDRR